MASSFSKAGLKQEFVFGVADFGTCREVFGLVSAWPPPLLPHPPPCLTVWAPHAQHQLNNVPYVAVFPPFSAAELKGVPLDSENSVMGMVKANDIAAFIEKRTGVQVCAGVVVCFSPQLHCEPFLHLANASDPHRP